MSAKPSAVAEKWHRLCQIDSPAKGRRWTIAGASRPGAFGGQVAVVGWSDMTSGEVDDLAAAIVRDHNERAGLVEALEAAEKRLRLYVASIAVRHGDTCNRYDALATASQTADGITLALAAARQP